MTPPSDNPWAERFAGLADRNEIWRRVARPPQPFGNYEELPPKIAAEKFRAKLESTYYPSTQCVQTIAEWMELALEHCQRYYPSQAAFLSAAYGEKPPLPDIRFPMCLTGLAGTGKSELLKALSRLMPSDTVFQAQDGTSFRMESHRFITVQAKNSSKDILAELVGQDSSLKNLIGLSRKRAYRDGWAFVGIDEFQFLTQSQNANTVLTQLLLLISYIGTPCAYACNFSMLYKLIRRSQEERQRLLGNIRLLSPEEPNSSDWKSILEWHKKIAPDVFDFDPSGDAEAIHQMTAGINRAESSLMAIAFLRAMETGRPVQLRELEVAYKSTGFATYRTDIELLAKLPFDYSLHKRHKDLWCPVVATPISSKTNDLSENRKERAGDAAIEASLNAEEKKAYARLSKTSKPKQASINKAVASARKSKSSTEQLKLDTTWFDENL